MIIGCQVSAQSITLKLFLSNPCADSVGVLSFYTLQKGSNKYYPTSNDGLTQLKDTGVYKLSIIYFDDIMDLELRNFGSITDTIKMYSIMKCEEPISHPSFIGYCCCDKKCDGKQVDYYQNGVKRLEGNFNEGKPVGKLIFYDQKGKIKEIHKYNKKGRFVKKINT
jgi:hypothetical protein